MVRFACCIVLVACSTSPDAGTSITGMNAFSATSTMMLTKPLHCSTSGVLTSGKLDAIAIVVADVDLTAKCPSGPFDILPHVLQLEVATGGYFASDPNAANQPITSGMTFPILNEHVADEDLCGNVPSGTTQPTAIAMLNQCPNGSPCTAYDFASTGSITVSDVSATSVAGSFDLTLVNSDGEAQGTLSGSFSANACP